MSAARGPRPRTIDTGPVTTPASTGAAIVAEHGVAISARTSLALRLLDERGHLVVAVSSLDSAGRETIHLRVPPHALADLARALDRLRHRAGVRA